MAKKRQSVPVVDEIKVAKKKSPAEFFAKDVESENSNISVPEGIITLRIPTGSIKLDYLLGGGIPAGRITQIYGDEGVGKTSLLYRIIAEAQKMGLSTVLVTEEKSFDREFATACGIDIDDTNTFWRFEGNFGEATLNKVIEAIRLTNCQLVGIDSIAAINPLDLMVKGFKEDVKDSDAKIGAQAKIVTEWITKTLAPVARNNVAVIVINQFRANIKPFGGDYIVTGGYALQYLTTLKLKMFKHDHDKERPNLVKTTITIDKGKDMKIKVFQKCEVEFIHGKGIQKEYELARLADELKIVNKAGPWYSYDSQKWQGMEQLVTFIKENQDFSDELENKIREELKVE